MTLPVAIEQSILIRKVSRIYENFKLVSRFFANSYLIIQYYMPGESDKEIPRGSTVPSRKY